MGKLNPKQFGPDGEAHSGGSRRGPGGGDNKRTDSVKASVRAKKALRKHQAAQHTGEKNEFGQRTVNKSQTNSCATCNKLQADVDATSN